MTKDTDPRTWTGAPKPIAKAAAEVERLEAVYREQFQKRDAASRAVNPAEQQDAAAIASAYGEGGDGGKVNPTRYADEARENAARQQSLLTGVSRARDAAVANLRAQLSEHGAAWEKNLLREVADAER